MPRIQGPAPKWEPGKSDQIQGDQDKFDMKSISQGQLDKLIQELKKGLESGSLMNPQTLKKKLDALLANYPSNSIEHRILKNLIEKQFAPGAKPTEHYHEILSKLESIKTMPPPEQRQLDRILRELQKSHEGGRTVKPELLKKQLDRLANLFPIGSKERQAVQNLIEKQFAPGAKPVEHYGEILRELQKLKLLK